jgi:hypothetical protein
MTAVGQNSIPGTGAKGMIQNETSHCQDLLNRLQELGNISDG